jgi:hypothetical protein
LTYKSPAHLSTPHPGGPGRHPGPGSRRDRVPGRDRSFPGPGPGRDRRDGEWGRARAQPILCCVILSFPIGAILSGSLGNYRTCFCFGGAHKTCSTIYLTVPLSPFTSVSLLARPPVHLIHFSSINSTLLLHGQQFITLGRMLRQRRRWRHGTGPQIPLNK